MLSTTIGDWSGGNGGFGYFGLTHRYEYAITEFRNAGRRHYASYDFEGSFLGLFMLGGGAVTWGRDNWGAGPRIGVGSGSGSDRRHFLWYVTFFPWWGEDEAGADVSDLEVDFRLMWGAAF